MASGPDQQASAKAAGSGQREELRAAVLDDRGHVMELRGRFEPVPRHFEDLAGDDGPPFAQVRELLDGRRDTAVRLESKEGRGELRISRVQVQPARYAVEVRRVQGSEAYRVRLEQRLAFEHLIASLSTEFIHASPDTLDALIEDALGRIGRLFEVDRAYLFLYSEDRERHSNTHEWVAGGISREAHNLQDLPITVFPWIHAELMHGRSIHVPAVSELPPEASGERAEFEREGIQSLVLVPFGEPARPEGFVGFDSVRRRRWWSDEIIVGLRLVGQIIFNALRSQKLSRQLAELAFHDPLTGLANRRLLRDRLEFLVQRCAREGCGLAVLLLDLDDFKLVNDSFGHSLGDEMLRTVAGRLSAGLRAVDVVGRPGGDEFVVVAATDEVDAVTELVQRLFRTMREPVELAGVTFGIRMSVGIALYPHDGEDVESLLRAADTAMYAAKAEGRDRWAFFTGDMTRASRATLALRHDLQQALAQGQVVAHLQPRVRLPEREVAGFEALARWCHPERGLLLPGAFLDLAEQSGQLREIDLGVLREVLALSPQWCAVSPDCLLSVNLSAQHLHDEDFLQRLHALLAPGGGQGIEIEITESSLVRDIDRAAQALADLRAAAPRLRIAIDDFGSGYSCLAYLGRLPVTTLKIDRGFTAELSGPRSAGAAAIVRAVVGLGTELGLHVVAEGVETQAQLQVLEALGCPEVQGHLFAPALPRERARALLGGRLPAPG